MSAIADDPQPASTDASPFPMPEILVTGRPIDAPRSVVVREATAQDMSAWNARTAGDALPYVPGVNVLYGGSSGDARIWIRGFRERDLLLLFDGVPIAGAGFATRISHPLDDTSVGCSQLCLSC